MNGLKNNRKTVVKRKLIFLAIVFALSMQLPLLAQVYKSKTCLTASADIGMIPAKEMVNDGVFHYPSFYNNMKSSFGFMIDAEYKIHEFYGIGISLNHQEFQDWGYNEYPVYKGSGMSMNIVSPFICGYYNFTSPGILKRTTIFADVFPSVAFAKIKTGNSFERSIYTTDDFTKAFPGAGCKIGASFQISRLIGISASYRYSIYMDNTNFTSDNYFMNNSLNLGVCFYLFTDKNIYEY